HHTLSPKTSAQSIDQARVGQRRRVDRDLFRAGIQNLFGVRYGTDATGDAERDVQHSRNPTHPLPVDRAAFRTRRDVIEHQLVRALVTIAAGELQDVAHDPVVAKANAFDYLAFADVETGDDASGKNGRSSSGVIRSSSKALPLTAAATPISASAARSAASRTPPEACQESRGKRDRAVRYKLRLGPDMAPSRSMSVHSTCLTMPAGYRSIASQRLIAVPSRQP